MLGWVGAARRVVSVNQFGAVGNVGTAARFESERPRPGARLAGGRILRGGSGLGPPFVSSRWPSLRGTPLQVANQTAWRSLFALRGARPRTPLEPCRFDLVRSATLTASWRP